MRNINEFDPSYLLNKIFIVKRRDKIKASPGCGEALMTTLEVAKSIEQIIVNDNQRHNIESIERYRIPVIYHIEKESTFIALEP